MTGIYGGTQLCKAHRIVAKLCPYCEIDRLRNALERIAHGGMVGGEAELIASEALGGGE